MRTWLVALGRGVTTEHPFFNSSPTTTEGGMLRVARVLLITLYRAGQRIWTVLSTLRPVLPAKKVLTQIWWVKDGRGVAVGRGVGTGVGTAVGLGVGVGVGRGGGLLGGGLLTVRVGVGVGVLQQRVGMEVTPVMVWSQAKEVVLDP
jgi:hypothetical protein